MSACEGRTLTLAAGGVVWALIGGPVDLRPREMAGAELSMCTSHRSKQTDREPKRSDLGLDWKDWDVLGGLRDLGEMLFSKSQF